MYSIVLISIFMKIKIHYFDISMLKYMFIFFVVGMLIKRYNLYKNKYFNNKHLFVLLLGLFLILVNFYFRDNNIYYNIFEMDNIILKLVIWIFKIFIAFIGIYLILFIVNNLQKTHDSIYFKIGAYMTLYIYVTHVFFISLTNNIFINFWILIVYFILFYIFINNINKKYLIVLFGR